MVPDSVPSKASQGEKTLYGILRDCLPDDFYVWYEPIVNSKVPDFIILGPTFGLLIIEVKGWYPNQIAEADSHRFRIQYQRDGIEQIETQQSPLRQGKGYLDTLLDKLKAYPILTQPDGAHQGKLAFPVGCGAVMSNMAATQSREKGIYNLLEQPQVAYRDELLGWNELRERELVRRLKDMFTVHFSFMALTDDQVSTIKGILHPEMRVREVPATKHSVPVEVELQPNSSVIKTLDIEQEQLARNIGNGHRLFYGVAGAGKTLILLARAKDLVTRLLHQRVLVLCYNMVLAGYLRSLLHDDQNPHYRERIKVIHFHDWAKSVLGRLPNPTQLRGDHDEILGGLLLEAITDLPTEQKWDSLLVDEAHTFSPSWFKCIVAALKDQENGELLIVSDGSQRLYGRSRFSWKSVGVRAQGRRSKRLNRNYRNTQEILSAAWCVIEPIQPKEVEDGDATFPVVEPSAAQHHGPRPILHIAQSREEEVKAVVHQIQQLYELGYKPEDIAILYRHKGRHNEALFEPLIQQLKVSGLGAYWVTKNDGEKRRYNTKVPGVRIITALSSLGLEFKVVVILWVQQFANCHASDLELATRERRELYVAMTRARESLHLFGFGNLPILHELSQSKWLEVREEIVAAASTLL